MVNKSRFSIAKQDIIKFFDESKNKVYSKDELSDVLYRNRDYWRLAYSLTVDQFIDHLREGTQLKRHKFKFKNLTIIRYSWGQVDIVDLALSLRNQGHLSHYSAIFYHQLTEQIPKTIYINVEQSPKEINAPELDQTQVDHALQKPARLSTNYAVYKGQRIYILKGKYTNSLGVYTTDNSNIRVTDLERTLIDVTVRPEYSGGVYEVIKAYENAVESISINKLMAYLKKLNFIYPYHQCIGFYMMITGKYRESQLELVKKQEMPYKFYLTHGIENKAFSKEWNIYYPATLSI